MINALLPINFQIPGWIWRLGLVVAAIFGLERYVQTQVRRRTREAVRDWELNQREEVLDLRARLERGWAEAHDRGPTDQSTLVARLRERGL